MRMTSTRSLRKLISRDAMSISELKELLEQSGLVFDAVYDAYTDDQVKCDSEKVTVIAHKA